MDSFRGTWRLVRLALRRDRIKLPIALASIGLFIPSIISGVSQVFDSEREMIQGVNLLAANPAMRLFGLPSGNDFGSLIMLRGFITISIAVVLISTFLVVRHTRQNEEMRRSELIRAGSVGRFAALSSTLLVALLANILMSALIFAGMVNVDTDMANTLPLESILAMAVAIGMIGMAFASIAAVCAQLAQTSRGANGLAAAGVGLAFLLTGIGSILGNLKPNTAIVEAAWPTWLSPFGWGQMLKPFAGPDWWVAGLFVAFILISIVLALILASKRDDGRGILDARPGPKNASPSLLSMAGLTWRMQRGVFFGWLAGLSVMGVVFGVMSADVEELLQEAEGIMQILVGASGADELILAFFGSIVGLIGIFVLAYAVQTTLRMRTEETGALEFLLTSKLGRLRWIVTQITFVLISSAIMLFFIGLIAGVSAELVLADTGDVLWPTIVGMLIQLPAIAVVVGAVVAIFGIIPRLTSAGAWTVVAVSVLLGPFFGSMFNLPESVLDISPLTHTPVVPPLDNLEATPLVVLSSIAILLLLLGITAFRRRDLTLT